MDIDKLADKVIEKVIKRIEEKVIKKVIERIEEKLTERLISKVNENVEKTSSDKIDEEQTKVEFLDISGNYSALNLTAYSLYAKDTDIKKDGELLNIEKTSLDAYALNFNNQTFNGKWDISYNSFNKSPPLLKKEDFTIKDMQCYFLVDKKGPTFITFPNASDWPHYWNRKEIIIKNLQDQPIFSSETNIRQLKSNEISNCILPSNFNDKYVSLMTNGKHWYIKSIF